MASIKNNSIFSMPLQFEFRHLQQDDQRIYLDNAATTQKPQSVIDAICRFYQRQNANVHRGSYASANLATNQYEAARHAVAKFIHAEDASHIVWTKGTTESINLVASPGGKNTSKKMMSSSYWARSTTPILFPGNNSHSDVTRDLRLSRSCPMAMSIANIFPN